MVKTTRKKRNKGHNKIKKVKTLKKHRKNKEYVVDLRESTLYDNDGGGFFDFIFGNSDEMNTKTSTEFERISSEILTDINNKWKVATNNNKYIIEYFSSIDGILNKENYHLTPIFVVKDTKKRLDAFIDFKNNKLKDDAGDVFSSRFKKLLSYNEDIVSKKIRNLNKKVENVKIKIEKQEGKVEEEKVEEEKVEEEKVEEEK